LLSTSCHANTYSNASGKENYFLRKGQKSSEKNWYKP
jgi:hypothetical protein